MQHNTGTKQKLFPAIDIKQANKQMSTSAPQSSSISDTAAPQQNGKSTSNGSTTQQQQPNSNKRDVNHNWEAVDGSSVWQDVQEDDEGNILTNWNSSFCWCQFINNAWSNQPKIK